MYFDAYSRQDIVQDFATRDYLTPAEFAALGRVWPCVTGDVLDLGVGGGRTTGYLRGVARSYHAMDISEEMARVFRQRHPGAEVSVGDARTLAGVPDAGYDLVLFSFNGIDYIAHDERRRVLASVLRVLRPGGAFVYSSHNLGVLQGKLPPVTPARSLPTRDPLRMLVRGLRSLAANARRRSNRRRLDSQQYIAHDHAVVNDEGYDHSMLTVYVDPTEELAALARAGFERMSTIDAHGRAHQGPHADPWVYYVAYRPAHPPTA